MTTSLRYFLLIALLASATFTKAQDIAKAAVEEAVKAGFTEVERQLLKNTWATRW